LNHQILSPYTAFVGVETTGPKINNTNMKVRHVPIQISKGDEHLFNSPLAYYHGAQGGPYIAYGQPVPMAAYRRKGPSGYTQRMTSRRPLIIGGV
jgi:hypothetical protein